MIIYSCNNILLTMDVKLSLDITYYDLHTFFQSVCIYIYIYVTGPGKTGLIYTKYTCLYYGMYLLFCMCYPKSVNCIKFLIDCCIYDDILDMIEMTDKKLLHVKLSKSGQILHVDKTCFPRPGHIYIYIYVHAIITIIVYKSCM